MNTTVTLFGFSFINESSEEKVVDQIVASEKNPSKLPVVCTPNAAQLVAFAQNPRLAHFFSQSQWILPDGQPIVWLSKWIGNPLQSRLTGSNLFPLLWKRAQRDRIRIFLVVSSEQIEKKLKQEMPVAEILVAPLLKSESDVDRFSLEVTQTIISSRPKWVLIGLGFPKQEYICRYYLENSLLTDQKPIFFLLGASFEFYCGLQKRAPQSWQKLGLEWLFRFLQNPGRLWHRYTVVNFQFILLALAEWRKQK